MPSTAPTPETGLMRAISDLSRRVAALERLNRNRRVWVEVQTSGAGNYTGFTWNPVTWQAETSRDGGFDVAVPGTTLVVPRAASYLSVITFNSMSVATGAAIDILVNGDGAGGGNVEARTDYTPNVLVGLLPGLEVGDELAHQLYPNANTADGTGMGTVWLVVELP